jgi:type II secretory pathway component GspD/PulD (secretin)
MTMRLVLLTLPLLAACAAPTTPPPPAPEPAPQVADAPAAPAPVAPGSGGRRIHIDVEDMDLAEVMERIGRMAGQNILVDPHVHERVTICLRDVHWRDAVDIIARMTRCEVEVRPGG